MKRDLILIKEILTFIEAKPDTQHDPITIEGFNKDQVDYNCLLLLESGYITGEKLGYGTVFPSRLTTIGHDFLDASRDSGIWKKATELIKQQGGSFTLDIVKTVLTELIKAKFVIK
ncbi:DUF2513 domain-containing protein [Mucilaginibacter sp. RB4R14]|uniref:DUF2513 domain-containing protein n=1 Tax=Mucilaginibacter aurantiaciroseus TaxID=2949308 RepID=UPI002091C168|nr:DUF2513 domain-containing protein [Mucilaginibacter aurantiaciroseus]MCO5934903.1 DUF2513 domain-containing protein [Mucilaginibacter aurantiaciroseus]